MEAVLQAVVMRVFRCMQVACQAEVFQLDGFDCMVVPVGLSVPMLSRVWRMRPCIRVCGLPMLRLPATHVRKMMGMLIEHTPFMVVVRQYPMHEQRQAPQTQ